jgi:hypothetical protein
MTTCTDRDSHFPGEYLGVWEQAWQLRAAERWKAERYRIWLRQQGASRDNAAERVVRLLAVPTHPGILC